MTINYASCENLDTRARRMATLEILDFDDPIMNGTPRGPEGHFMVDGLVPMDVALEINALFVRGAGVRLDVLGLDFTDRDEFMDGTGRVLIEGVVPFAIAEQAQAICAAHNASLSNA